MNWEALGAIAESLGALGVIATLIYLAAQIRQNSRLLASSAKQATQSSVYAQNNIVIENDSVRKVITKSMLDPKSLDADERAQAHFYWMTGFITYQEAFKEVKKTGADDDFWNVLDHAIRQQLQTPGISDWWCRNKKQFNPEFAEHFSNVVANKKG